MLFGIPFFRLGITVSKEEKKVYDILYLCRINMVFPVKKETGCYQLSWGKHSGGVYNPEITLTYTRNLRSSYLKNGAP